MTAPPRYATPRNPELPTRGGAIAAAAVALRRPLHPHQRAIADVIGEYRPDTGLPEYSEAIVVMPRRGGKTGLTLATLLERMRRRPSARAFYTEKTAEDATKVLRDEWAPIVQASPLAEVLRFRYARGDAGMYVQIGGRRLSRTEVFTPNASALHGRDADLIACDECWIHGAERGADIDAGIRPARWARPGSQVLYLSAGGTDESGWLNAMVERGRAGAPGVAYFEWSADADADGYDPYDERLWIATHPGIGTVFPLEALRHDARTMARKEWERAGLCVWDRYAGTALLAGWEQLFAGDVAPAGPLVLAFDVHPMRTSAAIAVAAVAGDTIVAELIDHRAGVGWLPARIEALTDRHEVAVIVRDPSGPAGATRLEQLEVTDAGPAEVAEACAWVIDAIAAPGTLAVRPHPGIGDAFAGARTYNRGDGRTVWARRTSAADLCPLYALTLAAWGAAVLPVPAIY